MRLKMCAFDFFGEKNKNSTLPSIIVQHIADRVERYSKLFVTIINIIQYQLFDYKITFLNSQQVHIFKLDTDLVSYIFISINLIQ